MRFEVGTFPGRPSSTPGSCRSCGIGYLRDGETGVVVTDWWIEMEGVIILCEACAAEVGRLVPNTVVAGLEASLSQALDAVEAAVLKVDILEGIVQSQRAEISVMVPVVPDLYSATPAKKTAKPAAKSA